MKVADLIVELQKLTEDVHIKLINEHGVRFELAPANEWVADSSINTVFITRRQ
jgi:hypothetical protein